jgi:hypothetical protein
LSPRYWKTGGKPWARSAPSGPAWRHSLTAIRNRIDAAYTDKLDGAISVDFWERKMCDWQMEEQQVKMAIQGLQNAEASDRAVDAGRIFELANKGLFTVCFAESGRKGQIAQNAIFELLRRRRKYHAYIQKAL